MARSDITTLIPLDRAALVLGIDPYHFNGIVTTRRPERNACPDIWWQFPWQKIGQAAREDLALTLREAEDKVIKFLGYSPVATWIDSEERIPEKPFAVEHTNFWGLNSRGRHKSVTSELGYVIEAGRRAKTLIQASAAIVYSDADGDGYNERATTTVATTVTQPQEIRLYFAGKAGDDRWEIRPIDVSIAGGVATIVYAKYQVPDPDLWTRDPDPNDTTWRAIDGDVVANFQDTADVYRVYTDPSQQVTFYNEDSCGICSGTGCAVCGFDTDTGCLRVRNGKLGILSYARATWNATTLQFDAGTTSNAVDPDKMLIHYRAGLVNTREKFPLLQMDPQWERLIVYYAYVLLDRMTGRCENTNNIWEERSRDLALVQPNQSYTLTEKDLRSPFGTTRAGIDLFRLIEQHRLVR